MLFFASWTLGINLYVMKNLFVIVSLYDIFSILGYLYDHFGKDYTVAFILAGIPPIFGAVFMFLIYKVKSHQGFSYDQASPVLLESSDQKVESLTGSVTVTTNLSVMDDKTQETESLLIQNSKTFYMNPFFMHVT